MKYYRKSHRINTMVIWGKHYNSHRIYINRCQKTIHALIDWASQWKNNVNFNSQKQAFEIWRKIRKLALHKRNLKVSQSLLNSNIRIVLQLKIQMKRCFHLKKSLLKNYTVISWPLLFLSSLVISFGVLEFQTKRESFNGS